MKINNPNYLNGLTVEATEINDVVDNLKTLTSSASQIDATKTVNTNTIVIDGDSIANQNGKPHTDASIGYFYSHGYLVWANIFLSSKFNIVANNGVVGERTDQLLTRLQASIDLKPKFMSINIGTNDITQNIDANIIIANMKTIIERITSAGIVCIMNTIIPRAFLFNNSIKKTHDVNSYLRSLQGAIKDFILVDTYASIVNPATDLARTDMLSDDVHPSPKGAYFMGKIFYENVDKYLTPRAIFQSSNGDTTGAYIANACMLGGTIIADGWHKTLFSGVSIDTKILRDNGLEWQEVNFTTAGNMLFLTDVLNFSIGKKVKLFMEIEIPKETTPYICEIFIQALDISNNVLKQAYSPYTHPSLPIKLQQGELKGILETPSILIPEGTVNMPIGIALNALGKVRFGRCRIIEVLND